MFAENGIYNCLFWPFEAESNRSLVFVLGSSPIVAPRKGVADKASLFLEAVILFEKLAERRKFKKGQHNTKKQNLP